MTQFESSGYIVSLPAKIADVREVVPAHWRVTRNLCRQLSDVLDEYGPSHLRTELRLSRTKFLTDIDPARIGITGATDYDHDVETQRVVAAILRSGAWAGSGVFSMEPRIVLPVDQSSIPWGFDLHGGGTSFYQPDAELRGVEQVNLVGWSTGAPRAGGYAALHPDKVGRLLLYGPSQFFDREEAPAAMPEPGAPTLLQTREFLLDRRWRDHVHDDGQIEDPAVCDAFWRELMAIDEIGAGWGREELGIMRAPNRMNFGWKASLAKIAATTCPGPCGTAPPPRPVKRIASRRARRSSSDRRTSAREPARPIVMQGSSSQMTSVGLRPRGSATSPAMRSAIDR
jgi:hypothetical protein